MVSSHAKRVEEKDKVIQENATLLQENAHLLRANADLRAENTGYVQDMLSRERRIKELEEQLEYVKGERGPLQGFDDATMVVGHMEERGRQNRRDQDRDGIRARSRSTMRGHEWDNGHNASGERERGRDPDRARGRSKAPTDRGRSRAPGDYGRPRDPGYDRAQSRHRDNEWRRDIDGSHWRRGDDSYHPPRRERSRAPSSRTLFQAGKLPPTGPKGDLRRSN